MTKIGRNEAGERRGFLIFIIEIKEIQRPTKTEDVKHNIYVRAKEMLGVGNSVRAGGRG